MDYPLRYAPYKANNAQLHTSMTLISLGIRPVSSKSSLSTECEANRLSFPRMDSADSTQTGRMTRLVYSVTQRLKGYLHCKRRGLRLQMSRLMKPVFGFPTRSGTNQTVQP